MKIYCENSFIYEKLEITKDLYFIKFLSKNKNLKIIPGQFLNVRVSDTLAPILRRPFSIFDFEKNYISILFKVKGEGTKILSKKKIGDKIDYVIPLGNGFKKIFKRKKVWFVAGGIGLAGLFYAFKKIKNSQFFVGFNSLPEAREIKNFLKEYNLNIAVLEKQSEFFSGSVIDLVINRLKNDKPEIISGCGPYEMLKSLYKIARQNDIETEFLLEKNMACGFGACYGCSIKILNKNKIENKLVCKDGPVFEGEKIVWS